MTAPTKRLTPLLLALLASTLAAAPTRDDSINSSFNAWALKGLQAAREWRADACLAAALVDSTPGVGPGVEHLAGGEIYEFFYYSAENPTADYRFRSPLLPYEAGKISPLEASEEKGPGAIAGPRRCITDLPVTLQRAIAIARKAGLSFDAKNTMEAHRSRFAPADFKNPARAQSLYSPSARFSARGREVWSVAEIFADHSVSCVTIDARTGRVLKKVLNASDLD